MHALLNLIHVATAVLWAGGALFLASFVGPAARAAGPGAAPFMGALVTRTRLTDIMTWASLLTVGSGMWLWARAFGADPPPASLEGVAISIGAVAGVAAMGIGVLRQRPTVQEMRALLLGVAASGGAPSDDQAAKIQAVRSRMTTNANMLAVAVAIAVIGMALAG